MSGGGTLNPRSFVRCIYVRQGTEPGMLQSQGDEQCMVMVRRACDLAPARTRTQTHAPRLLHRLDVPVRDCTVVLGPAENGSPTWKESKPSDINLACTLPAARHWKGEEGERRKGQKRKREERQRQKEGGRCTGRSVCAHCDAGDCEK